MASQRRGSKSKAVAYTRVSTDTERQELGAEGQRHAIEQWAEKAGVTIVAWYTEAVSGGAPLDERDVLLEALAAVKAHGAGYLVCASLDRFSRDPLSAALAESELARARAELVFADGSASGDDATAELVRGILLAVHRFERRIIAKRVKVALGVKKRRGELTGAAPYGHRAAPGPTRERHGQPRVIPILEPSPDEQNVIASVVALSQQGMSIRQIGAELASRGVVGRRGRPLTRDAIHRILQRQAAA